MGFTWFGRGTHANGHAGRGGAVVAQDGSARARAGAATFDPPAAPATGEARSVVLTFGGWRLGRLGRPEEGVLEALSGPSIALVTDRGVERIDRDEIVMVVPPPVGEGLRSSMQPVPVAVDLGVAVLRGRVHVLPGVSPWEAWQRSSSGFVTLTDAILDFPDGSRETAGTVLVSRHAAHAGLLPA